MSIVKRNDKSLILASQQLLITERILERIDPLYKKLTDITYIERAVTLAYDARMMTDAYIDPFEFQDFNKAFYVTEIEKYLKNFRLENSGYKYFTFPKSSTEQRVLYYIPFFEYSLRFLLGLVVQEILTPLFKKNIFGGIIDVFNIQSSEDYKIYFNEFINWQKSNIKSGSYKYLLSIDIKEFYANVDHEILSEIICNQLVCKQFSYFNNLLKNLLKFDSIHKIDSESIITAISKGLVVGSLIDTYFANIYLMKIDDYFSKIEGIEYGRMTDDIRIFFNNFEEGQNLLKILSDKLSELNLELNKLKSNLVETSNILENNKSFFKVSALEWMLLSEVDLGEENRIDIDKIDIKEILENEELLSQFLYSLKKLINEPCRPCYLGKQISNIEYIIKNSFRTQHFYQFITNLYITFISNSNRPYDSDILDISSILIDDHLNDYVKYLIVKSVIFENEGAIFLRNFIDPNIYKFIDGILIFLESDNFILFNTAKYFSNTFLNSVFWVMRIKNLLKQGGDKEYIIKCIGFYLNYDGFLNIIDIISNFHESKSVINIKVDEVREHLNKEEIILFVTFCREATYNDYDIHFSLKLFIFMMKLTDDDRFMLDIGRCYSFLKNTELAFYYYDEFIRIYQKNDWAYYFRGIEKRLVGDLLGAKNDFEMAIRISPSEFSFNDSLRMLLVAIESNKEN